MREVRCEKCYELEQHLSDAKKMEEYYRTVVIPEQLKEISRLKKSLKKHSDLTKA